MRLWRVLLLLILIFFIKSEEVFEKFIEIHGVCVKLLGVRVLSDLGSECIGEDFIEIFLWEGENTQELWAEVESQVFKVRKAEVFKWVLGIVQAFKSKRRKLDDCLLDVKGCKTCESNKCIEVYSGYYISQSLTVEQCSLGCKNCTESFSCEECFDGYFLSNETCQHCPGDCLLCDTQIKCLICSQGFYLTDDLCNPCLLGCKYCKNSTDCGECYTEYYLNPNSQCIHCPTGCSKCTSSYCIVPLSGYSVSDNIVFTCPSNCKKCSSGASCKSCNSYYYINQMSLCSPCPIGCLACTSSEICTSCLFSYYLNSKSLCSACLSSCELCKISLYCNTCKSGYYFSESQYKCIQCGIGCYTCTKKVCVQCIPQYTFDKSLKCTNCGNGFEQCPEKGGTVCFAGLYLDENLCKTCSVGCKTCTSSSKCTSCEKRYYLNNFKCFRCSNQCSHCEENGFCVVCNPGFYNNEGVCKACKSDCEVCESLENCLTCLPAYYFNGQICESCYGDYESCVNSTYGVKCNNNFFLSGHFCFPCETGCKVCTDSLCLECSENYFLSSGYCQNCEIGCLYCNSTLCFECLPGFYMSDEVKCNECSENCEVCSGSSKCEACYQGFYLKSDLLCGQCPGDCKKCTKTLCLECNEGFFINSLSNCELCTKEFCICESGFYYSLTEENCISCSFECETCSNSTLCQSCVSGFYLDKESIGKCIRCKDSACSICSQSTCTECKLGYFIESGQCLHCKSYCKSCKSLAKCLECEDSFELFQDSYCIPCPQYCISCLNTLCLECFPGFTLQDSICTRLIPNCLIYSGLTCQYCQFGFTELLGNCPKCATIQILDVKFDEYFQRIIFSFNREIEFYDEIDCATCKFVLDTEDYMGNECLCYGEGNDYILKLVDTYYITVSTVFFVKTEKLFEYVCDASQLIFQVNARFSVAPESPIFEIRGTKNKSLLCVDQYLYFNVIEVQNSYGYDLVFTWFVNTEPENQIVETFVIGSWGSGMIIPVELFGNISSKITVTAEARNIVKLVGNANFTSWVYNYKMIGVEIDSPQTLTIKANQDYTITGLVTDSCYKTRVRKKWISTYIDLTELSTGLSHLLFIPAFYLKPLSTTAFNFTAYSGSLSGYTELKIYVEYTPLMLIIDTVNSTVSNEHDLRISADQSYDPNQEISKSGLICLWEYCELSDINECMPNTNMTTLNTKILTIEKASLPPNNTKWGFTVTLSSKNSKIPSATKNFFLTFKEDLASTISLFLQDFNQELTYKGLLLQSSIKILKPSDEISLKWDVPSSIVSTVVGVFTPYLYVYKFDSEFKNEYQFVLKSFNDGVLDSFAEVWFVKNQLPVCSEGGLYVDPEVDGYAMKTYYDLSINSCTDADKDFPLAFRFSVKFCIGTCTGAASDLYTPYIQISIRNRFAFRTCKLPEGTIKASVQVCDTLGGCNAYKKTIIVKENKNPLTNGFVNQYYEDILNPENTPYYSIIYIRIYDLNLYEYNNIYNNFYSYLKKQKKINSDIVHIYLTFINEMFKSSNKYLRTKLIVNYLSNAKTLISRHSDEITDQNADVVADIIYNINNCGIDLASEENLVFMSLDFILFVYSEYAIERVVGDLIVKYNKSGSGENGFEYYKFRDTAQKILKKVDSRLNHILLKIDEIDVSADTIINIDLLYIKFTTNQSMIYFRLSESGSFNTSTLFYEQQEEVEIPIEVNSVHLVILNKEKDPICLRFTGKSWKDQFCDIDYSNSSNSNIIISASGLYQIVDKSSYYQQRKVTYIPLIVSSILTATPIAAFIINIFYNNKKKKFNSKIKEKQELDLNTTYHLIVTHTLCLSIFSKDPQTIKTSQILQLFVILGLQLTFEGLFIGYNLVQDTSWAEIVGIGFISPLLTIPHNLFAQYRISASTTCFYKTFLILWFFQLFFSLTSVILINILLTNGHNTPWIYSFGIGLSCELIVEFFIMVWKNLKQAKKPRLNMD